MNTKYIDDYKKEKGQRLTESVNKLIPVTRSYSMPSSVKRDLKQVEEQTS
jgi:hypothetical protein